MNALKNKRTLSILFFISLAAIFLIWEREKPAVPFVKNEGMVHGTFYHFIYENPDGEDLHQEIKEEMASFEMSLSTFKENSVISRINSNDESVKVDALFKTVFLKAEEISRATDGAFDMTVAPLVNAWGFGFKHGKHPDSKMVDSLMQVVGYEKVTLEGDQIKKEDPRIMLDASAIAKGYSVDVVTQLLESHGIENYLVEIGGELVAKGHNDKGKSWRVGIDKPLDDPSASERELQDILQITNKALATSGNYRQFYIKDGKKYAHTIDPKTGFPVQHNLLSASVLADDCMTADAFATSFMVMGVEKALRLAEDTPGLEAYLIYVDQEGFNKVVYTSGFSKYLDSEKK